MDNFQYVLPYFAAFLSSSLAVFVLVRDRPEFRTPVFCSRDDFNRLRISFYGLLRKFRLGFGCRVLDENEVRAAGNSAGGLVRVQFVFHGQRCKTYFSKMEMGLNLSFSDSLFGFNLAQRRLFYRSSGFGLLVYLGGKVKLARGAFSRYVF